VGDVISDGGNTALALPRTPLSRAEALRRMTTIRRFEERSLELASEGLIQGSIHLCLGQEAIPVGALAALEPRDRVLCTYRGHGWALAAGVPLEPLLAELCQRADGLNGGRGGSPHLFAPEWGLLGENSIVGAGVPVGAGVALAAQVRGEERVVLTSIGDGAMNQGSVHEGLVFAAARRLPLIVLVENNGWAEMTPSGSLLRIEQLVERAAAYGIEGQRIDGSDPLAVQEAVTVAAATARGGEGPVLLEVSTLRLGGHYNRDIEHYRPKADRRAAEEGDALTLLRTSLLEAGELSAAELEELEREAAAAVDAVTVAVRAMPEPEPATAREHLYGPPRPAGEVEADGDAEEMTYVKAVTAALRTELAERPETLVYGEDVGFAGGIFGASRGLQAEFGEERVFDTPIAESAILGSAVGAAMEGMRPIVEIMWGDFLLVALDQLVNQAANVRYVTRSELTAPLVVRTQQGVTPGSCAQHSQSLEALLAHVPGLRLGLPSTPQDAYDMLRAAVAEDDPVVLIEGRALYLNAAPVRTGAGVEPVGGARVRRRGGDLTILTWGALAPSVLEAGELLAAEGVEATIVDLRWLNPLDDETIEAVVRAGSGRVLVAHEANLTGGFGAEIAARIQSRHFEYLDAPVSRLGVDDSRIPSAPALQRALVPDAAAVVAAARELLAS
jgi:2-oxoisovalerate dehydrogenase E1 component